MSDTLELVRELARDLGAEPDRSDLPDPRFSEWHFAYLELRAARAYLERRIAIAKVKQEHGLLSQGEMDDLILEGAELKADVALWKAYK